MDKQIEKSFWNRHKTKGWFVIGMLSITILLLGLRSSIDGAPEVALKDLRLATVKHEKFTENILVNGTIEPLISFSINASEGGQVTDIYVEEGDSVSQGQPLLMLSNRSLELDYMQRETQLIEQIANLRNQRIALNSMKFDNESELTEIHYQLALNKRQFYVDSSLHAFGDLPQKQLEETIDKQDYLRKREHIVKTKVQNDKAYYKAQLEQIDATLGLLQRNLSALKSHLDVLEVKAPMTGQINGFIHHIGETKNKGTFLGRIDNNQSFKLVASVDQHYLSRIQIGQKGNIKSGDNFPVEVFKILPTITDGSFQIELKFSNKTPHNLRRGQNFRLDISLSAEKKALTVPKGSFYNSSGGKYIFVLSKDSLRAKRRNIRIGEQSASQYEIKSGLKSGEVVITSSYNEFEDQKRIKITKP